MITGGEMLREVVSKVFFALAPIYQKLFLFDAVLHPVKSHIDGFGPSLFDGFIGKSDGSGVVRDDMGGWLWVPHFLERCSHGESVSHVEENGAKFCFRSGCKNHFHDGAIVFDGAIIWGQWISWGWYSIGVDRCGAKKEVAAESTASFRLGKVGCITVDVQNHIGFVESKGSIGMGVQKIE